MARSRSQVASTNTQPSASSSSGLRRSKTDHLPNQAVSANDDDDDQDEDAVPSSGRDSLPESAKSAPIGRVEEGQGATSSDPISVEDGGGGNAGERPADQLRGQNGGDGDGYSHLSLRAPDVMNVDMNPETIASSSSSSSRRLSTSITLDTSTASWNTGGHDTAHPKSKAKPLFLHSDDEEEGQAVGEKEEERPTKRRRSLPDPDSTDDEAKEEDEEGVTPVVVRLFPLPLPRKPTSVSERKSHQKDNEKLRQTLLSFARPGSDVSLSLPDKDREEKSEPEGGESEPDDDMKDERALGDGEHLLTSDSMDVDAVETQPTSQEPPKEPLEDGGEDAAFDDPQTLSQIEVDPSLWAGPTREGAEAPERPEIVRDPNSNGSDILFKFDMGRLESKWSPLSSGNSLHPPTTSADDTSSSSAPAPTPSMPSAANISNLQPDGTAERALARVIEKSDFLRMDVMGQFNLGFIVARRRKGVVTPPSGQQNGAGSGSDDLFIIDQHASDEKYNFETLQQTTVIKSQKLFQYVVLSSILVPSFVSSFPFPFSFLPSFPFSF
jgi:DNA mismatch repair ATPase MutL